MTSIACQYCGRVLLQSSLRTHLTSQYCARVSIAIGTPNPTAIIQPPIYLPTSRRLAFATLRAARRLRAVPVETPVILPILPITDEAPTEEIRMGNLIKSQGFIKSCNHYCCNMSAEVKCCWCADKRSLLTDYTKYKDGRGDVATKKRNRHYCPICLPGRYICDIRWSPENHVSFDSVFRQTVLTLIMMARSHGNGLAIYPASNISRLPLDVLYLIISFINVV